MPKSLDELIKFSPGILDRTCWLDKALETLVESDIDEPEIASTLTQSTSEVLVPQSQQILPLVGGVHTGSPLQVARSTSNDIGEIPEAGMTQRISWPRNESGTYLPTRATSQITYLGFRE